MSTHTGITIGRPSSTCAATGQPLHPGDRITSVLWIDPDGGTRRQDAAQQAWDDGWRPDGPGQVLAIWRGVVPQPRLRQDARPVEDEDLLALFEQIEQPQDRQAQELRYVLAWMLIRRRRLRLEGQRNGVLRLRQVSASGALLDAVPFEVADPGLDEDQLEQAMERVAALLLGEPDEPGDSDPGSDSARDGSPEPASADAAGGRP